MSSQRDTLKLLSDAWDRLGECGILAMGSRSELVKAVKRHVDLTKNKPESVRQPYLDFLEYAKAHPELAGF